MDHTFRGRLDPLGKKQQQQQQPASPQRSFLEKYEYVFFYLYLFLLLWILFLLIRIYVKRAWFALVNWTTKKE